MERSSSNGKPTKEKRGKLIPSRADGNLEEEEVVPPKISPDQSAHDASPHIADWMNQMMLPGIGNGPIDPLAIAALLANIQNNARKSNEGLICGGNPGQHQSGSSSITETEEAANDQTVAWQALFTAQATNTVSGTADPEKKRGNRGQRSTTQKNLAARAKPSDGMKGLSAGMDDAIKEYDDMEEERDMDDGVQGGPMHGVWNNVQNQILKNMKREPLEQAEIQEKISVELLLDWIGRHCTIPQNVANKMDETRKVVFDYKVREQEISQRSANNLAKGPGGATSMRTLRRYWLMSCPRIGKEVSSKQQMREDKLTQIEEAHKKWVEMIDSYSQDLSAPSSSAAPKPPRAPKRKQ